MFAFVNTWERFGRLATPYEPDAAASDHRRISLLCVEDRDRRCAFSRRGPGGAFGSRSAYDESRPGVE